MNFQPHVTLDPWQEKARDAWMASRHAQRGAHHGIADVYTGAGKTFLGMACMVAASGVRPAGEPLRALYSPGVRTRFGRPTIVR